MEKTKKYLLGSLFCCFAFSSLANDALLVVTESSPPMQMLQDGKVTGLATNKVKDILAKANLAAEFRLFPWARAYDTAKNQPNVLIYSMAKSSQREKLFHWIAPIAEFRLALISLADSKLGTIDRIADALRFRLSVQRDDIAHSWLLDKGFNEERYFVCSDILCSWNLLINRKVDFIIEDPQMAPYMLEQLGKTDFSIKTDLLIPELDVVGYLAASKNTSDDVVIKLKQAASQLNIK